MVYRTPEFPPNPDTGESWIKDLPEGSPREVGDSIVVPGRPDRVYTGVMPQPGEPDGEDDDDE